MAADENTSMGNGPSNVKSEPREPDLMPLTRSAYENRMSSSSSRVVKSEGMFMSPSDMRKHELLPSDQSTNQNLPNSLPRKEEAGEIPSREEAAPKGITSQTALATDILPTMPYTVYSSAADIDYTPENVLKEGLSMVESINVCLKDLRLGSQLRQDVWTRELDSLRLQSYPATMIAVCGATGAGKSSLMNALLDDNIVPTSGMRACTAVATEISYHNKSTIEADVAFLSEAEWRAELSVLLSDLIDENGKLRRSTDLKSEAGVAWHKVGNALCQLHAVYPSIMQDELVNMNVDQILQYDTMVAEMLGTRETVRAADSKAFTKAIGKYIDSKDQKRRDKKDRHKKSKGADLINEARGQTNSNGDQSDAAALWPLIRNVKIRCSSPALSTGSILVDLPGVADANAARNKIAKDYMKNCNCIWILAPITRAVDDKTAKDLLGEAFKMQLLNGSYDDHTITFIASKCDDISCSEVIHSLNLKDDPELEEIENKLCEYAEETRNLKTQKAEANRLAKNIEKSELKHARECLKDYENRLEALKENMRVTPRKTKAAAMKGKKRKNIRFSRKGSHKKRRESPSSDDEDGSMVSASDDDISTSSINIHSSSESDAVDSNYDSSSDEVSEETEDEDDIAVDYDQTETKEDLGQKIKESKHLVKSLRKKLFEARRQFKELADQLAAISANVATVQREKNAYCSLKRSESSRDSLKEDFRTGLKELDDAAAEARNPLAFDPSENLRDYDAIDLPVFTCSSRDYIRIRGQVEGDGEPTCFSNVQDTGIPDLRIWCRELATSSHKKAANKYMERIKAFAASVDTFLVGAEEVNAEDCEALRNKWETVVRDDPLSKLGVVWDSVFSDNILTEMFAKHNPEIMSATEVGVSHEGVGVCLRLRKDFKAVVDKNVEELKTCFKEGLEAKCRAGAVNAANLAVETVDELANTTHWMSYRATLRRHGSWRRDLNMDLVAPLTRNIAHSWSKIFESDLFQPFEKATLDVIVQLLKDVEGSAAASLKKRTKLQGNLCLEDARVALQKTMDAVKDTMSAQQKEISRCLAPHVQARLIEGYNRATEERGRGSVVRQKAIFRTYVDDHKDAIFEGGASTIMDRLSDAANAVGDALNNALGDLAQKVEVNLSVLWKDLLSDATQVEYQKKAVAIVSEVLSQIELWQEAAKMGMDY